MTRSNRLITRDPLSYVETIRKQVLAIDPGQPISAVLQRRLVLLMLGVFAQPPSCSR